ncbi:MAG: SIMPL domain-containing protein [Fusobacteriaceae bacterium]
MKKLIIFMSILFSLTLFSQEIFPTVALQGKGNIKLEPDRAEILFQVITNGKELPAISDENRIIMDRVKKTIDSLKIKKENIKTTEYSINKVPQFNNGNNIPTYTYEIRNGFLVTVEDMSQVAKFIAEFEKAGVNSVNNILFYSSKEEDSQNKAMILAYKDAYSKALNLAKEAGYNSVSSKELNYDYFPIRRNAPYSMDAVAMKGSMEIYTPQSLDFTVIVRAVFNMEK